MEEQAVLGLLRDYLEPQVINMQRVRTPLNYHTFPRQLEVNTLPSETVPDQTMSIREILERFAKGLPVNGAKVAYYDDEDDESLPDPRTLDLADLQALKEEYKNELLTIQQKIKQQQNEKETKKDETT